jgi:biopolymer transport protein ExbD
MRFFTRKRRQPPAVIIVALIDVLIVVMIFLMVTTTFKKPVAAVKLTLPESSQALKMGANDNPPLVVSIEENGSLRYGEEARPVTLDDLKKALQAEVAKNPQTQLALNSDKNVPFGRVVKIMDVVKEANIKNFHFFVREVAGH